MADKEIHIVFQVLNFLSGNDSIPFNLSDDERLLLIYLAKHQGQRGIYPSVNTLGRELKKNVTSIRRTLSRLSKKYLILIDYVPGKSSSYTLSIQNTKLSTDTITDDYSDLSTPRASTPYPPGRPRPTPPGVHARQSERVNNKKEIIQRGRARKRAPLSDLFLPNNKTIKHAQNIGLTQTEANQEFDKFLIKYAESNKTSDDWDSELRLWFSRFAEYKKKFLTKSTYDSLTEKPDPHKVEEMKMARMGEVIGIKDFLK